MGRTARVLAAALLIASCSNGDSDAGDSTTTVPESTDPSTAVTTSSSTTSSTTPDALADATISTAGLGPVRIGMTLDQASSAIGFPLTGEPVPSPDCYFVSAPELPETVSFMLSDGTVARVDVADGSYATVSGAMVGDTEAEIMDLFGARIEVSPHAYTPGGNYLTFVPVDPGDAGFRVVFETDGSVVTHIRSGRLPEVEYVEGCA